MFIIIAISLFALMSINVNAESGNALRYGRQTLYSRPNSSALVAVYDRLAAECASSEQHSIEFQGGCNISLDELHEVFNVFFNDV